ncbi:MAG: hypothetical protein ACLVJ6_17380 [Merdibacter sp.]
MSTIVVIFWALFVSISMSSASAEIWYNSASLRMICTPGFVLPFSHFDTALLLTPQ